MKNNKSPSAMWPIGDIKPYALNVKQHDKKQVEKIAMSIKKFGWLGNPIVVNEEGEILAGHGRRLAAISLDMTEVPVEQIVGLSLDAQRAYRLADNRVAISGIDSDMLQKELADLDFDLIGLFDKKELDFMVADLGEMSLDSFVDDMGEVVANQNAETSAKVAAADERDVKVDKVLGFKVFKGRDERVIAMFIAQIEATTGQVGADAFVSFVKSIMQPSAAQLG